MQTLEKKIQFKNHFFTLRQGRVIPGDDHRFWQVFWTCPRAASDIFELLTPNDVQAVRDQNLPNMLVLVQVLISKISSAAQDSTKTKNHRELLNCVRFLAKILPHIFELPAYYSEIEPRFFLASQFNPLDFLSAGSSPRLPVPAAPNAEAGSDLSTLASSLVFSLVRLLFVDNFTVDPKHSRADGSKLCLWEPGLGRAGHFPPPDAIYDSHRSDILKLLLVLISTTFYERVPNVVIRGSVFMTLLVSAVPNHDFLSLVCSITNLVCRSGKNQSGDLGIAQDHPTFFQLRLICLMQALQLLASMMNYAMPNALYTNFLMENGLIDTTKPVNRVRRFFALLSKESDLHFLSNCCVGILKSPIAPVEASEKQKSYRSSPSPMFLSALILLWEMGQCNAHYKRTMQGRLVVKFAPCLLYHVFAYYDVPQHSHLVKIAARFLLHISSQPSLVRALLITMLKSQAEMFPPEFRVQGPISTRDFLVIHMCQVLIAVATENNTHKPQDALETQRFILSTLVECLYNIVPFTNPAIIGTDSLSKGLANLNPGGGLSYQACKSINQVLLLFSAKSFLVKAPGNAELLALLLRALCAAATKAPIASRRLLLSFVQEETMYNNIWTLIHELKNQVFCGKTARLITVPEDAEMQEREEPVAAEGPVDPKQKQQQQSSRQMGDHFSGSLGESNNGSASQVSMDFESSDESKVTPTTPPLSDSSDRAIEELEDREIEESLRPHRPAGMSATAREKLPRDTPVSVSWGGNDALRAILFLLIPLLKEKLGDVWGNNKGFVQDAYKVAKKIERSSIAAALTAHRPELHYDCLPETPVAVLRISWDYVSLGWYMSMVARDIYIGSDTIKTYMGTNKSLVSNLSLSLAVFGKIASSWSSMGSPKHVPHSQDAAITDYLDQSFCLNNLWAQTSINLFKIKRPEEECVIQAFGMKFGSVGLASSVNDITHSLVKRFSDLRGTNTRASDSSAGSAYLGKDATPELPRLTKQGSLASLHSLNALNRTRPHAALTP